MTESNEEFHNIIKQLRSSFAEDIKTFTFVIYFSELKSGQLVSF